MSDLNGVHWLAAAAVPLFGMLLMGMAFAFFPSESEKEQRWALIAASAGGLGGLLLVMWLRRVIDLDSAALSEIAIDESRSRSGAHRSSSGSSHRSRSTR